MSSPKPPPPDPYLEEQKRKAREEEERLEAERVAKEEQDKWARSKGLRGTRSLLSGTFLGFPQV